jgi:hypothetical protein
MKKNSEHYFVSTTSILNSKSRLNKELARIEGLKSKGLHSPTGERHTAWGGECEAHKHER